jgi:hypothetical protein
LRLTIKTCFDRSQLKLFNKGLTFHCQILKLVDEHQIALAEIFPDRFISFSESFFILFHSHLAIIFYFISFSSQTHKLIYPKGGPAGPTKPPSTSQEIKIKILENNNNNKKGRKNTLKTTTTKKEEKKPLKITTKENEGS